MSPDVKPQTQNLQTNHLDHTEKSLAQEHNGPKRFLLFDNLIATIVDFDEDDGAPIVEFSMCPNEEVESKLPVECGICPDIMHRKKLEKHMETHIKYVNGIKRYSCIYCDENFASRACAAGHLRRHEGIRPYVCESCKVYYCTKQDLKMHQRRRHWAKNHICEICGKTFTQNSVLRNHILSSHEQQRRFSCDHCGKRFLRRYAMTEHIRNVHLMNRRPLQCTFCDKIFNDTHKLAQHRKDEHLNQACYECRICGLEFTTIEFFDAHQRSIQCRNKYRKNEGQVQQQQSKDLQHLAVSDKQDLIVIENEQNEYIELHDDDGHVIVEGDNEVLYEIAVDELTHM